jgi:hypothetical protein
MRTFTRHASLLVLLLAVACSGDKKTSAPDPEADSGAEETPSETPDELDAATDEADAAEADGSVLTPAQALLGADLVMPAADTLEDDLRLPLEALLPADLFPPTEP